MKHISEFFPDAIARYTGGDKRKLDLIRQGIESAKKNEEKKAIVRRRERQGAIFNFNV